MLIFDICIVGSPGSDGEQGTSGPTGLPGSPGRNGGIGRRGRLGFRGIAGPTGRTGSRVRDNKIFITNDIYVRDSLEFVDQLVLQEPVEKMAIEVFLDCLDQEEPQEQGYEKF